MYRNIRASLLRLCASFLMPTSDNSPAMMPSSHSGLVGTGVATVGTAGAGATGVTLLLAAEAALVPNTIRGRHSKCVSRAISQPRHVTSQGVGVTGRTGFTARC